MTAHRLSASSVHLARHCLHSFREDVPVPPDKPGPAAKKGTAFHFCAEHLARNLQAQLRRKARLRAERTT